MDSKAELPETTLSSQGTDATASTPAHAKSDSSDTINVASAVSAAEEKDQRKVNFPLKWLRAVIYGEPLKTQESDINRLPKLLALPVFCSDAISSVAYGPQQILLALTMAGLWLPSMAGMYNHHVMLISSTIFLVLVLVSLSYWQTIFGYPSGGGSYIVTKDNLGTNCGLFAAAALLIDYVLCVSVSVASGLQNLKDVPLLTSLHIGDHLVIYSLLAIFLMTWLNLRGLREPGLLFAIPFYIFIGMSLLMIAVGLGAPIFHWPLHTEFANQTVPHEYNFSLTASAFSIVVVLRAFATGCSALTGIECVSNGIPAFKEPSPRNAAITLIWMAIILGSIFMGVAMLSVNLHIVYWEHSGVTAPAVIDQLSGTVFGKTGIGSIFYNLMQFSTALILMVAAQTSFADFPRVTSILARDGFMPRQLTNLGDRLAFDNGVVALGFLSSLFIIAEKGSVDMLIPFFTIGVFQAFSLSQIGMVKHWFKVKQKGWHVKALLNGLGAVATLVVFLDIITEKFRDGAWFIVIMIGILLFIFKKISGHYEDLSQSLSIGELHEDTEPIHETTVLVLVQAIHAGTINSVRYARSISQECRALFVEIEPNSGDKFRENWKIVFPDVQLTILPSPYRSLLQPVLNYVDELKLQEPDRKITVVIGEFTSEKWWHSFLHGNTGLMLKLALLSRPDLVVTNVRYKINSTH
ncbi:MAG TPA: APC family permease [Oculatellaceae cyanobacterium]